MSITKHSIEKLQDIHSLLSNMTIGYYTKPLSILNDATVGQHMRHIIEFFICIKKGIDEGMVSFDERERNPVIENDKYFAKRQIRELIDFLDQTNIDKALILKANYSGGEENSDLLKTSLFRELAYALDHTVHHLAIVKIALSQEKINLGIDENFGVAPSTIRNRKQIRA